METTIRRVLPIRQDIAYWFCFTGAETEIHKIKDDSKIKTEKNIDRRGQRHMWTFGTFPAPLLSRYQLPLRNIFAIYVLINLRADFII